MSDFLIMLGGIALTFLIAILIYLLAYIAVYWVLGPLIDWMEDDNG